MLIANQIDRLIKGFTHSLILQVDLPRKINFLTIACIAKGQKIFL